MSDNFAVIGGDLRNIELVKLLAKDQRKVFYGQKRREIGEILRTLCNWKKVKIVEAEVCPDHIG